MDRLDIVEVFTYIENNLKTDISLAELARIAGYSPYHFLRVFKHVSGGFTPARYIRKRRLTEIVREMAATNRTIYDIAAEYSFNSKENFTRAFQAEHHIAPSEFRSAENSLLLFYHRPGRLPAVPEPRIVRLDNFELTVFADGGDTAPNCWNRYNARGYSRRLTGGRIVADYGVNIWNAERRRMDYFIGVRADDAQGDTSGTIDMTIDGGLYAVFATPPATLDTFVNTIHAAWRYIIDCWLPASGYRRGDSCDYETYIETSRTYSEDIYISIKE